MCKLGIGCKCKNRVENKILQKNCKSFSKWEMAYLEVGLNMYESFNLKMTDERYGRFFVQFQVQPTKGLVGCKKPRLVKN